MTRMNPDSARLSDPDLPAVEVLLGPDAAGPLGTLLEAGGIEIGRFRPRQVTWWPRRSITVRYDVSSADGQRLPQIVACSGSIPPGATILEADGTQIGLWVLPADPDLPGLASILDPRTLRPMLESIGVPAARISARLRAYRPRRRAVVQVDTEHTRVYVKLGRPDAIRRLHETHQLLAQVLPVPLSLGFDPDLGLLVMPAGRGLTLREALDTRGELPAPRTLDGLLGPIPNPIGRGRARSPIDKLASLQRLLSRIVPDQTGRLEEIVGRIGPEAVEGEVPCHGDFHDGQLLVDGGVISGLLDVDTHGTGHPSNDPATMLGHLESRRPHAPQPDQIGHYAARLGAMWAARVDPWELVRRRSAVMLGLATGPFRVQQDGWPDQVRARIGRAGDALGHEKALIGLSEPSHTPRAW